MVKDIDAVTQEFVSHMESVAHSIQLAISDANKYIAIIANAVAVGMPAGSNLTATLRDNLILSRADLLAQRLYCVAEAQSIAFTLAPSGNSPMSSPAYRTKATATSGPIVFTAVNTGPGGNSIALVFDGVDDVIMVEDAWNTANPTNMVSYTGPGDTVIAASTITLSGGADNTQPPAAFTAPSVIA